MSRALGSHRTHTNGTNVQSVRSVRAELCRTTGPAKANALVPVELGKDCCDEQGAHEAPAATSLGEPNSGDGALQGPTRHNIALPL